MAGRKQTVDINDPTKSTLQIIFLMAWPVFLEQMLTTLVSYADTAMVGALGANATAAVTISNTPIFLLNGVVMALGVGVTTLIAQATGAGNREMVRKLEIHALLIIIFIGIPIAALVILLHRAIPEWMGADPEILDSAASYNLIVGFGRIFIIASMTLNSAFRGYGDTKTPMVIDMIMNAVNIVGNFFLINKTRTLTILGISFVCPGAGWGVNGAAAATAFSMFVSGVMCIWILFRRDNGFKLSLKTDSFRFDKDMMGKILKISLPAMLERLCMSSSGIFVTKSVATLGTTSVAAYSLALSAESLSYMPAFSFQTADTTLVGQALGSGRPDRAEEFTRKCCVLATILMAFTSVGLYVFCRQLMSIFTPDQDVISLGARCIQVLAVLQIPQALAWVLSGTLRGAGDTNYCFYITAATNWGIRTLFSILCISCWGTGIVEIHWVMVAEIIARLGLLYWRYKTGKWKSMTVIQKTAED